MIRIQSKKFNYFLPVFLIFFIAAVKFFSQLTTSMFEADQEYLAVSAKSILEGNLTLIGAPTSVGGMFIGPFYNYFIAAFMAIFKGNPLVVNGLSFLWATLIILLIYLLGKKLIGEKAAFLSSLLALASHDFLNHDSLPPLLFPLSLIILFIIYLLSFKKFSSRKKFLIGFLIGLSLNLHFSGIFLIPLVFFIGSYGIIGLLIPIIPLFLFELRHNFLIFHNLLNFIHGDSFQTSPLFYRLDVFIKSMAQLIKISDPIIIWEIIATLIICYGLIKLPNRMIKIIVLLPLIFFLIYPAHLLPYYAIIAWIPFLFFAGYFMAQIWNYHYLFKYLVIFFLILLGLTSWQSYCHRSLGQGIDKKIAALKYIKQAAGDKPFYLSRTMIPSANFGFDYLIYWLELNSTNNPADATYTLVIPYNFEGIKSDIRFGNIGVVLPEAKNNEKK